MYGKRNLLYVDKYRSNETCKVNKYRYVFERTNSQNRREMDQADQYMKPSGFPVDMLVCPINVADADLGDIEAALVSSSALIYCTQNFPCAHVSIESKPPRLTQLTGFRFKNAPTAPR